MSDWEYGWTLIQCDPEERGADAIIRAVAFFRTEGEALDFLADVRDDDPETGNGWTILRVQVWSRKGVAA